jgi:hypothetical protein
MEIITEKKKKLRSTTYAKNPFWVANDQNQPVVKSKTKRITNNKGGYLVQGQTGEIVSPIAGFWTAEEVDNEKFVKLFINGMKAFTGLTNKGAKVFELMYREIQANQGKDKIYLNFVTIDQDIVKIAKSTFYYGLNELVDLRFLAPTQSPHVFWINPDYVWNGDRLAFVKTYIKKETTRKQEKDTLTLDLFNGEEERP